MNMYMKCKVECVIVMIREVYTTLLKYMVVDKVVFLIVEKVACVCGNVKDSYVPKSTKVYGQLDKCTESIKSSIELHKSYKELYESVSKYVKVYRSVRKKTYRNV